MASSESRLLIPGLTFVGTKTSSDYVHVDPRNANSVDVEMWPDDSSGTALATATVLDSFDPAAGFNPVTDTAYTTPSGGPNSLTAITAYQKVRIGSVMEYVRVKITITSGTWYIRVTPLTSVSGPTTVTNTASQNLTQISGTAITLSQKTMANSLPVVLASDQSVISVQGSNADTAALTQQPVVIGGRTVGGLASWAGIDANRGIYVDQETSNIVDDGIAVHAAAGYPAADIWTVTAVSTITRDLLATFTNKLQTQGFPSMLDVRHVQLTVDIPAVGQALTGVQITSAQTSGGHTETKAYSPTLTPNQAQSSLATYDIPTPNGLNAAQLSVIYTWGGVVTATGVVTTQAKLFTQPIISGTKVDRSGTTSGTPSTSTALMAANTARRGFEIQNTDSTTMWINFTTAAAASQPSIQILPGAYYRESFPEFVTTEAINVLSTVASKAYTAKEW